MPNQFDTSFVRLFAGALLFGAANSGTAFANEADDPAGARNAGPLPANVLCWPSAPDGAIGEHHRPCGQDRVDGRPAIDLKAPFRQFDAASFFQSDLLAGAQTNSPAASLADLGALFDPEASLSKSDLLLLRATSVSAPRGNAVPEPINAPRRVAGIKDFGDNGALDAWTLRPEVPAYLANEAAGLRIATQSVRDLRPAAAVDQLDDEATSLSFWTRAIGREDELDGVSGTTFTSQTDTTLMHAGVDYDRNALFGDSDRLHLGVMATYGSAVSEASAAGNSAHASGKTTAARAGAYATWYENEVTRSGLYVDGWVGLTLLDNSVIGDDLPAESYPAMAWAGSLETGYGWRPFGTDLRVEPRVQFLFARYDQPAHEEINGTAVAGSAGGLSARLGIRLDQEWRLANEMVLKPYAEMNWRHDFTTSGVSFDDVYVGGAAPEDRLEFKLGLDAKIGTKWSMGVALQTQQEVTDYDGLEALVSVKCDW